MRLVLGAIGAALIVGGCATIAATKVGEVDVVPTGYSEVQLSGTTVHIRYRTIRRVEQSRSTIADTPDLWTSVSFDSLPWVALELYAVPPSLEVPHDCSTIRSTSDPAPAMTLHAYSGPFASWYSYAAPGYGEPIAAYVEQLDGRRLVLVRASSADRPRAATSLLAVRSCPYKRPWAPFARAALVPFAVVADIVTAPFQILLLATLPSVAATGK